MKFAFYSHKGGVGRTTTAVNTAYQLSKKGKKVCIIDLDIEAPGLTLFDRLRPFKFEFDVKNTKDLNYKDKIFGMVEKELKDKEKPLHNGRIEINKYGDNEWIVYDEKESYIAFFENAKMNVISNPLGVLEFLNDINKEIKNDEEFMNHFKDKSTKEKIKQVKKHAPPIEKYIYKINKEEESDGDVYIMRVFSPWERKYTEKKGIFHTNVIPMFHLFDVLTELIESTYKIDYLLIDSRPGYEEYMQDPLFNCTDGIFICMDFNEKIENLSLEIGKIFADKGKSIKLVLTKDPTLYKEHSSNAKKIIDERINSIKNTCKKLKICGTLSTITTIPYYFNAVTDYNLISDQSFRISTLEIISKQTLARTLNEVGFVEELKQAYKEYERVADEIIALNPDDVLNKINNAVKIDDLDKMKSEFNGLKNDPLYKNNFNLFLEYGKQLQERGQYSDACSELISAYKLQKSSDIAYLIGDLFFKIAIGTYLFSWNKILANDSGELIYYLKKNEYVTDEKETKIDKTDDGKTITITAERKIISLSLNNEKTELNLKIVDNISNNLIVKEENGHLNIYDGGNDKSNFESAIEYFEKAKKDYAKKSLLYSKLGNLYFECYKSFPEDDETDKYFDKAMENYNEVIKNGLHDPDNYYKMGEILTKKASLLPKKISEKYKLLGDANKKFEQAVLRKSSETKARMQWAQNLYDMASITEDDKKKPQYLDKAWELLDELIQEDKEYIKAYYLLGLVQAQLAIYERRDTRRNLLVRACDNLNKILTYEKNDKNAHFYLGAILFIIKEEMEEDGTDEKFLYFRDAFYHFEWTVSLHYNSSDFYFTSGEIDAFSTDTYQFVRTLEKLYEFNTPSLFKQWILNKEIDPSEQYNAIIEKAIERKN